jgi:hypothetical protein
MNLVYINKIGSDWTGINHYEFLFSSDSTKVDGEDWDSYPASGRPSPPSKEFINKVGILETDIELILVQESDSFAVWDAVDGIVALGWEDISQCTEYPENRLVFKFNMSNVDVENIIYGRDMLLKYKTI